MSYRGQEKRFSGAKLFNSKILAVFLLIPAFLVIWAVVKEKKYQDRGAEAVDVLRSEITALESKNAELSQLISYLSSQEFAELEAREKLNMKKPGEKVIIVPRESSASSATPAVSAANDLPNYLKWYRYFFE